MAIIAALRGMDIRRATESAALPGSAGVSLNVAYFLRPQGAFGVRQLAAAFENGPIGLFFKRPLESGSEQPHISERLRLQKPCGI